MGLLGWIFFLFFLFRNRNYTYVTIPLNSASTKLAKNLSIFQDNKKEAARHSSQPDALYPWALETVLLVPHKRLAGKS